MNTISNIPSAINNYYDRRLLERAKPTLLFNIWGQVRDLPRNSGEVVKFRKYGVLASATTPLTEGVTPAGSNLSVADITATPLQYGDFVILSDKLLFTTLDPVLMETADILGDQAGLTLDTITRDILVAGTSVQYCDVTVPKANASTVQVAATDVMSEAEITIARTTLVKNHAKKITQMVNPDSGYLTSPVNACYVAIIHPDITAKLYVAANYPNFVPVERYANKANLLPYEIGKINDVRFVESTEMTVLTGEGAGSVDVYVTLMMGSDAYGVTRVSGEAMKNIVKPLGSAGTADPLDQRATSGWKATHTALILQQLWLLRIEHALV